jgi:hypothetical protein
VLLRGIYIRLRVASFSSAGGARRITLKSSTAGHISILSLQGRVVKSISLNKAGTVVWVARMAAKGRYLLQMQYGSQMLRDKIFVR